MNFLGHPPTSSVGAPRFSGIGAFGADLTPEQMEATNEAWMSWGGKAGPAIVDFGSPALATLLEGHPHVAQGGTIGTYEFLAIPGA